MKISKTSKSSRPINHVKQGYGSKGQKPYVEKLDKSRSAQLKSDDQGTNRDLSIDIVYEKLQGMKDEYKQFYGEEQNFEGAWHSLLDDPEHFLDHLIEILEAHNHVLEALAEFDRIFETHHSKSLTAFLSLYEEKLLKLPVILEPDGRLKIKHRKIRENFRLNPQYFDFLTQRDGFLKKLFDFYHSLKAIQPPTTLDEDQLAWYQGLFMDRKA